MRRIALCCLLLAGCAATGPKDLQKMSIAEVCYLGMTEENKQPMAMEEVRRRNEDCSRHKEEIAKIRDQEMRAGGNPGGTGMSEPAQSGSRGGGMGKGY
jgi:hypothetical protein